MQGDSKIDRRQIITGITGLAGLTGIPALTASGAASGTASGAAGKSGDVSVPANGRAYGRIALRSDVISVAAVQSRIRAVDGQAPESGIRDNLAHMLDVIDKVQFFGGTKDLLCFHEFPLQGWNPWDRKELESVCIEVPGPETEAIAARARKYGCYIKFGAYVKDRDWPGHVLSITTIIGPKGELVARDWKARNIVGVFPGIELVTTTIYNVLDRYVEMYGADAVVPVHRTDIGNLATSSTQLEPGRQSMVRAVNCSPRPTRNSNRRSSRDCQSPPTGQLTRFPTSIWRSISRCSTSTVRGKPPASSAATCQRT